MPPRPSPVPPELLARLQAAATAARQHAASLWERNAQLKTADDERMAPLQAEFDAISARHSEATDAHTKACEHGSDDAVQAAQEAADDAYEAVRTRGSELANEISARIGETLARGNEWRHAQDRQIELEAWAATIQAGMPIGKLVACPACRAPAWNRCTTSSGDFARQVHLRRTKAAHATLADLPTPHDGLPADDHDQTAGELT